MFSSASKFNGNISKWNVAKVTNMTSLFEKAYSFNRPLGDWDVSQVLVYDYMFSSSSFNQDISLWNISPDTPYYIGEVEIEVSLKGMFMNATKFNRPLDTWSMGGVWNVEYMFADAVEFNQPLNSWNTSYFFFANSMFRNAKKFNQSLSNWFGPAGAENALMEMSYMFSGASRFQQNLCPWYLVTYCAYEYIVNCTNPIASSVFPSTSCLIKGDPDFVGKGSFCSNCVVR
jgi:surface protein